MYHIIFQFIYYFILVPIILLFYLIYVLLIIYLFYLLLMCFFISQKHEFIHQTFLIFYTIQYSLQTIQSYQWIHFWNNLKHFETLNIFLNTLLYIDFLTTHYFCTVLLSTLFYKVLTHKKTSSHFLMTQIPSQNTCKNIFTVNTKPLFSSFVFHVLYI